MKKILSGDVFDVATFLNVFIHVFFNVFVKPWLIPPEIKEKFNAFLYPLNENPNSEVLFMVSRAIFLLKT